MQNASTPVAMIFNRRNERGTMILFLWIIAPIIDLPLTSGWNQPSSSNMSRRQILSTISSAGVSSVLVPTTDRLANADPRNALLPMGSGGILQQQPIIETQSDWTVPTLWTKLGATRIGATTTLSPLQQQLLPRPFASQELYYPKFLFGEWNVTATLKRKIFPFGRDFVPSISSSSPQLLEGSTQRNRHEPVVDIGDSVSYLLHYFSTLADTPANQLTVNLGLGVPQPVVIADRSYNVISRSQAYHQPQLSPIESVEWDYRNDPTRLTIRMESIGNDKMQPGGQQQQQQEQREEVYLTGRQSEEGFDDDTGRAVFCALEQSRRVTIGPGNVISATDEEIITEFHPMDDEDDDKNNHIWAVSRIAVYLTPNPNARKGILWQQVSGRAVALYDYEWNMTRTVEEFQTQDGFKIVRPCVKTPKDVIQCA